MAAAQAARRGRRTILLDRNREPGVKILLSGGTRCNLTHATDAHGIVAVFGPNGRFLHSALAALGPQDVIDLFASEGVPTKIEPGGKVFPASDRASDVRAVLVRLARQAGCTLALGETVLDVVRSGKKFQLITQQRTIEAENLLIATGGQSYPACGTTGDGYRWSAALGHRIITPHTALVPLTSHANWVLELQGITLPDVVVQVIDPPDHSTARSRGSLLFAHFGISGPVVLDVSHAVSGSSQPGTLRLRCDLLPGHADSDLDVQLMAESRARGKRRASALLDIWLPHRVGSAVVAIAGIAPDRPAAELSKNELRNIARCARQLDIPVAGTMGFRKAELTAGGVALDEVDSRTMQSRIVAGLYFAGELLDLNGPVGGYNFQAAFSTGWLAGESA